MTNPTPLEREDPGVQSVTVGLTSVDENGVAQIEYTIRYPKGQALAATHSLRQFNSKVAPTMLYGLASSREQPLLDYLASVGINVPSPEDMHPTIDPSDPKE